MHTGVIMVFDPRSDGGSPSREEVCSYLASRLGQLPRYGQRLSEPHTGGMSWPEWQDDSAFDIARTSPARRSPPPEAMRSWRSGHRASSPSASIAIGLPWEMALVEGLAHGRWAIATKTHHCMVDGVGSADVGHLLLDTTPDAAPVAASPPTASGGGGRGAPSPVVAVRPTSSARPAAPGSLARLAQAWAGLLPVETMVHATQMGVHGVLHPRDSLRNARSALDVIVREELHAAPRTSLNVQIGTLRRFEVVRVPLADLKEIKSSLGGTINDVVLTVTASGLRALLQSRDEALPAGGLRAMVPINIRAASERLALGDGSHRSMSSCRWRRPIRSFAITKPWPARSR